MKEDRSKRRRDQVEMAPLYRQHAVGSIHKGNSFADQVRKVLRNEEPPWSLEHHVFCQSTLFACSEPFTIVLVASLADDRYRDAWPWVLEYLGYMTQADYCPDHQRTPPDIRERVHRAARSGLWNIVRVGVECQLEEALWVLQNVLEEDDALLNTLRPLLTTPSA